MPTTPRKSLSFSIFRRRPFRATVIALAVGGMMLSPIAARPAHAWGRLGHRVIARVASDRLTPAARARIKELLEPGETLADCSTWADEHRDEVSGSSSWHFVNVPISRPGYEPRDCAASGCVVSKLDEFKKILADPKRSKAERRKALRFTVHLLQDLHQPLHVGERNDRGGNGLQLQFFNQNWNLHSLWDSGMFNRVGMTENQWVKRIADQVTAKNAAEWSGGTAIEWANESHAVAKLAYKNPGDRRGKPAPNAGTGGDLPWLKNGDSLGQAYLDANLPRAEQRLTQAAIRLSAVLNDTLK